MNPNYPGKLFLTAKELAGKEFTEMLLFMMREPQTFYGFDHL